jgi:hypothetical protein
MNMEYVYLNPPYVDIVNASLWGVYRVSAPSIVLLRRIYGGGGWFWGTFIPPPPFQPELFTEGSFNILFNMIWVRFEMIK